MQMRVKAPTPDGWWLGFRRIDGGGHPVLLVPGFAMNTFILGFHPTGRSLMAFLADAGHDVWGVNMRGQGDNKRGSNSQIGLAERALIDLPAALRHIRRETGADSVDVIGCSLGGTLTYALLAHDPSAPVRRVVAIGSPLTWRVSTPWHTAFGLIGPVAGRVPIYGSRLAARSVLPLVARLAPRVLSIYLNADHVDISQAGQLVRTIEDPAPRIRRQLAAWIRAGDLVVGGVNVVEGLSAVQGDLMVVTGTGDGIAPRRACLPALEAWGGPALHLDVGSPDDRWAHADLFIADRADDEVFAPIVEFLR